MWCCVRTWVAEAISLLAINTSSAVWYRIWRWNELYFESWFRNPPKKEQKLGGKSFWKNFIWSRDGAEKKYTNKTGLESLKNPTPLRNDAGPPLWPPTQCTCIPSSLCCVWVTKWTRDASALHWRPERGPASFRSGVGFLRLSNPVLFVYFFQLHPYSKWSFFRNFFPLVYWCIYRPLAPGPGCDLATYRQSTWVCAETWVLRSACHTSVHAYLLALYFSMPRKIQS